MVHMWDRMMILRLISFLAVEELCQDNRTIDYFIVTRGNEAEVDLVLIQPFLLYHVNHVVLANWYLLIIISMRKGKRFVSKQVQPQPQVHSKSSGY